MVYEWIKKPSHFLVITGPQGTGKTYLCRAVYSFIRGMFESSRFYNEREFFSRIRRGMGEYEQYDYLLEVRMLTDDKLIGFDDLGSSGWTSWREEVLLELIDYRYCSQLPTIFTTNLSEEDFNKEYHPRISSRLFAKENTIIDLIGNPDLRKEGL